MTSALEAKEAEYPEWGTKLTESYDGCRNFISEHQAQIDEAVSEANGNTSTDLACSIKPTVMSFCLFGAMIGNCPADKFKSGL